MKKAFYYGEYHIPKEVKDMMLEHETGTAIVKALLKINIEETDSKLSKVLLETLFEDVGVYGWNDENYAYSVVLPNERAFEQWKKCLTPFREWLAAKYNISMAHEVEQLVPYEIILEDSDNSDNTILWKARKYFFQDIPNDRGFDGGNIISGSTKLHDEVYPSRV